MKQNIKIEAEGSELVLKNKAGDYVIIPKKYRTEVQDMLKDGCHGCIDNLVDTLPVMEDYAEDGSLYPEEPVINPNSPIKLPEVTVKAEAPTYIKYKQAWEKENPFDIDKYVEDRFNNPVGREAIKRINERGWKKILRQEGLKKRQAELDEAIKMGLLYQRFNPQGKDDISIADEQFSKRYGTSPHRYRYDNDSEYRKYYEQQARNATSKIDYSSTDLRRKDIVAPNNMWMYPNLTGENKKAMTDFSNEVIGMALPIPGLDAMGKIPSVFKVGKNLIKPVSKVVNKTDDVIKLYHYTNSPLKLEDIDVLRIGESQMKKRYLKLPIEDRPAGFYTNPDKYASFMGGKQGYELHLPKDIRIKDMASEGYITDRIAQKDLKKLIDEGYDVIKGKNMIGKEEWILLNKDKVKSFNYIGERYTRKDLADLFPDKDVMNMTTSELDNLVSSITKSK